MNEKKNPLIFTVFGGAVILLLVAILQKVDVPLFEHFQGTHLPHKGSCSTQRSMSSSFNANLKEI